MSVGFKSSGSYGDFDTHFITERELVDRYGSGKIWSWCGFNGSGSSSATSAPNGGNYLNLTKNIKYIWQDYSLAFAITDTGQLWAWGAGSGAGTNFGEIGNNSIGAQYSPVQTSVGGNNWLSINSRQGDGGGWSVSALKTDGTVWCWGNNNWGNFGTNNSAVHYSTPMQFMAGRTFKSVSNGGYRVMAVTSNGELWGSGYNVNGTLGNSQVIPVSSPIQIGGDTNWKMVNTSRDVTHAIKTDGTLWGWGYFGATGDGTLTYRSSPVQESTGDNTWVSVSGTRAAIFGIKQDGSLWSWGNPGINQGQQGNEDAITVTYPRRVAGTQNWKSVEITDGNAFNRITGLTKDGQIWTWGWQSGSTYALADSTTVSRSRPVQVLPGRFWRYASNFGAIY